MIKVIFIIHFSSFNTRLKKNFRYRIKKVSVIFVKQITKLQSREIKAATLSFQVMKLTKRFSRLCRFLYNYRVFQNLWDFWKSCHFRLKWHMSLIFCRMINGMRNFENPWTNESLEKLKICLRHFLDFQSCFIELFMPVSLISFILSKKWNSVMNSAISLSSSLQKNCQQLLSTENFLNICHLGKSKKQVRFDRFSMWMATVSREAYGIGYEQR